MHFQVLNYIFGTMIILDKCISYWILFDDNDYDYKKMSEMLHGTIYCSSTHVADRRRSYLSFGNKLNIKNDQ